MRGEVSLREMWEDEGRPNGTKRNEIDEARREKRKRRRKAMGDEGRQRLTNGDAGRRR